MRTCKNRSAEIRSAEIGSAEIRSAGAEAGVGLKRVADRRRARSVAAAVVGAIALTAAPPANAADVKFVGSFGNYGDPTNWAGNVVPAAADQADIANAGTALINPGDNFAATEVWAGNTTALNYGVLQQSGGTLAVSQWFVVGRFGSQGEYDLSGGTLNVAGNRIQLVGQAGNTESAVMRVSGTGTVVMNNDGNPFVVADGGNTAAHLYLQDSASVTCTTNEFWIGQGANTTTGLVDMTGGTLTVGNWVAIGRQGAFGTLNISGGTLTKTGANGNHISLGSIGGNGTVNQSGTAAINSSGADIYVGETGTGTWVMTGGVTTALQMRLGQTTNGDGAGVGILNLSGGTLATTGIVTGTGNANASSLYLNGTTIKALATTATFINGFNNSNVSVGPGGAIFDVNGFNVGVTAGLNGSGGLTVGSSANGATGSITLLAPNNYAGNTTVNGGALIIGPAGTLGAGTNVTVNAGGILGIAADSVLAGKNFVVNSGGGVLFENYTSNLNLSAPSGGTLLLGASTGTPSTLAGKITGAGSVTYVGPGILILSGANTYSGGTIINGGALQGGAGNFGTGPVVVNTGGTIAINSDAALAGSTVTFNGGGVTFVNYSSNLNFSPGQNLTLGAAQGASSTLNGTISNNGSSVTSVTYIGPGTLSLTATNPYTGGTNITSGVLATGPAGIGTGAVNVLNGSTLNASSGLSTVTGPINVVASTLAVGGTGLGSAGTLNFSGGSTLQFLSGTADPTAGRTTLASGGLTIDTNGSSPTITGAITGPAAGTATATSIGNFTKIGPGTLTDTNNLNATVFFVKAGGMTFTGNGSSATLNGYTSIGVQPGDNGTLTLDNGAKYSNVVVTTTGTTTATTVNDFNLADVGGGTATNVGIGFLRDTNNLGTVLTTGAVFIGKGGTGANGNNVSGSFTQTGGTFNGMGNVQVGVWGPGTYNQAGGTFNVGSFLSVGRNATGLGTYLLSGGTLNANAAAYAIVGEQGTGTMTLTGGTLNAQGLSLGHNDGGNGTVTQLGGTINAPSGVVFGVIANGLTSTLTTVGVLNLSGGTINTPSFTRNALATVSGTVNFNGSTVNLTAGGKVLNNLTAANVLTGGAILNTNGFNAVLGQGLAHDPTAGAPAVDGGLTKAGLGTLSVVNTQAYTGATVISGGTLQLTATANPLVHFGFNNVSGTTVVNDGVGGSTYNGTLNGAGATITTAGKFGSGLALDGSGASLNLSAGALNLNPGLSWTVSMWVNTTKAGSTYFYKGAGGWANGNTILWAGAANGQGGSGANENGVRFAGGFFSGNAASVTDGTFHLVTYTDNAGTGTIYLDNTLVNTGQVPFGNADIGNIIAIGLGTVDAFDGTLNFQGTIDEVRLDNAGLTAAQVQQLYTTNTVTTAGVSNLLPTTTALNVSAAGAAFDLNGISQTVASLRGVAGSAVTLGGGTLTVGDATNTTFSGTLSGTGGLVKNGTGTLTLASGVTTGYNLVNVGPVTINAGTLSLGTTGATANHTVLVTSALTLNGGRLDVGTGDADLPGASLSAITALAAAGFNNGASGIVSTAAAANSNHTTAVAVVTAGQVGRTTFDNMNVSGTDVLVKYTYFGDANIDGKVDGSDYSRIDNGFLTAGSTGWYNGDFNYDNKVDGSDYSLIDNAFNRQAAVLSSAALVASPTALSAGGSAVPEPTTLGLLGLAAAGLLGRRKR